MATIHLTRRELYDKLWEKPMSAFMEELGISYTETKKLVADYQIPVPSNGYWSRLRAGYTLKKTPFTESSTSNDQIIFQPRVVKKRVKREVVITQAIKVAVTSEEDGHIIKARKVYGDRSRSADPKHLIKIAYESINLNVSPLLIDRALNFMDALFKMVKRNGGKVSVAPHSTLILIDGEEFFVALREKQNRIEQIDHRNSWISYDFVGSGTLIFKIGEQTWRSKEWSDTAYTKIEEKLESILESLREMAIKEKKDRADQIVKQQEREAEAKVKRNLEKLREDELARFIELKNNSVKWENAQRIRRYLDDMERQGQSEGNIGDELKAYLEWSRSKADWYDPLVAAKDELLNEVDRDTLSVVKKGF
ncbi:hypothetical protein [Pedobacter agri]|uniref:hypothetical protein n=1 Tax=Pedobacter agri TaxID=454586 RepID=UPI00292DFBB0|nr:hypothetical protein [Pedobacter agri]